MSIHAFAPRPRRPAQGVWLPAACLGLDESAAQAVLADWLQAWGLSAPLSLQAGTQAGEIGWWVGLAPQAADTWMPQFDTLHLAQVVEATLKAPPEHALACETLLAMLGAPLGYPFSSFEAWASAVRVRCHIAQAAQRTALAFKTQAAERPEAFWRYDEDHGFVLQAGANLVDALVAATQPEATGRLYDFSCYRATEYVILLGVVRELAAHHPALLAQLQQVNEFHAIRSGLFHDTFLVEHGEHAAPLPPKFYVPGDRVWFRNPDIVSSDVTGYEGSWVIYMGGGLFSNFWRRDAPFTLEAKCVEIFHWRHALTLDEDGDLCIDEGLVARHVADTVADPQRLHQVLGRMMRHRDGKGIYAEGGCIDTTREHPRCVAEAQTALPETLAALMHGWQAAITEPSPMGQAAVTQQCQP